MSHEEYSDKHIHAFVADITSDRLSDSVPEASVDICTMIFVLSALSPDKMEQVRRELSSEPLLLWAFYMGFQSTIL